MWLLEMSEDFQESELVSGVCGGLSGKRELVWVVCRSAWRDLVRMSAVLFLELTPPIRMLVSI
jgi:hypothetical protein